MCCARPCSSTSLSTFGSTATVPPGLQSRHGVLASYGTLGDGADLKSEYFYRGLQLRKPAAKVIRSGASISRGMISEGLFVSESGRYRFRHPLLRDFCMMGMGSRQRSEARPIVPAAVRRLENLSDSLARIGAWRQVLEAERNPSDDGALANNLSLSEPTRAVAGDEGGVAVGHVLGEFDDPRINTRLNSTGDDAGVPVGRASSSSSRTPGSATASTPSKI